MGFVNRSGEQFHMAAKFTPGISCVTFGSMSALPRISHLSPEDYLLAERLAETKSDYLNGIIVGMAGATYRHNVIAGNVFGVIREAFRKRPCIVFGSDMKVRIGKANAFRYPDVSALCGPINFYCDEQDVYCNPQFICEVLSPSSCRTDRNEKFAEYRFIDTFTEYLIIEQDKMEVDLHRKGGNGIWTARTYTEVRDEIELESIAVNLTLADIYEKIEFDESPSK